MNGNHYTVNTSRGCGENKRNPPAPELAPPSRLDIALLHYQAPNIACYYQSNPPSSCFISRYRNQPVSTFALVSSPLSLFLSASPCSRPIKARSIALGIPIRVISVSSANAWKQLRLRYCHLHRPANMLVARSVA